MEIRQSCDHLISTMEFPILVRRHLYIESGPWWCVNEMLHYWYMLATGWVRSNHLNHIFFQENAFWNVANCQTMFDWRIFLLWHNNRSLISTVKGQERRNKISFQVNLQKFTCHWKPWLFRSQSINCFLSWWQQLTHAWPEVRSFNLLCANCFEEAKINSYIFLNFY